MTIDAVSSTHVPVFERVPRGHFPPPPTAVNTAPPPDVSDEPPAPAPEAPSKPDKGRAHGVLRLLAAGHFKPTPTDRLMAKFGDLLPGPDDEPTPKDESPTPADDGTHIDGSARALPPTPTTTSLGGYAGQTAAAAPAVDITA